jgi:hypothetical protein
VKAILETACMRQWWYTDPMVEGEPYNRMTFAFTVSARDQWWCHRRAIKLAARVCAVINMKPMPEPIWQALPPHMNRGQLRVPREKTPAHEGPG